MSIYFKFRSAMEFTRLSIPSHSVAAGDLKRLIVERKRLDRQNDDFDLLLSDANTGKVIHSDLEHIPRNARILVRRLHADASRPGILSRIRPQQPSEGMVASSVVQTGGRRQRSSGVAQRQLPRDETSSLKVDGATHVSARATRRHLEKPVGVPASQLQYVSGPEVDAGEAISGSARMAGPTGESVEVAMSSMADGGIALVRTGRDLAVGDGAEEGEEEEKVGAASPLERVRRMSVSAPTDLRCVTTQEVLWLAVVTPCCGALVNAHAATENGECPLCGTAGLDPAACEPDEETREQAAEFLSAQGDEGVAQALQGVHLERDALQQAAAARAATRQHRERAEAAQKEAAERQRMAVEDEAAAAVAAAAAAAAAAQGAEGGESGTGAASASASTATPSAPRPAPVAAPALTVAPAPAAASAPSHVMHPFSQVWSSSMGQAAQAAAAGQQQQQQQQQPQQPSQQQQRQQFEAYKAWMARTYGPYYAEQWAAQYRTAMQHQQYQQASQQQATQQQATCSGEPAVSGHEQHQQQQHQQQHQQPRRRSRSRSRSGSRRRTRQSPSPEGDGVGKRPRSRPRRRDRRHERQKRSRSRSPRRRGDRGGGGGGRRRHRAR